MKKLYLALSFSLGFIFISSAFADQLIRYNISVKYPDPKHKYYIDLLDLALQESIEEYGSYQLQSVPVEMLQGRTAVVVELDHGIDVTWRMTTEILEKRTLAVRIPLLKGLMGYRIFVIRKNEQERFPADMTFEQLTHFVAGQGHDWPDSEILKYNKLKVTTGSSQRLYQMLEKGRFDYFPRAIHEPWIEIKNKPNVVVEQNILLKYPAPIYFFVNKDNTKLHDRILLGLNKAIANGKFDQLFYHHPVTENMLLLANLDKRIVFELENPLLSPKSKAITNDNRLWLGAKKITLQTNPTATNTKQ